MDDNLKWARWARRICTALLWLVIGFAAVFGVAGVVWLAGPTTSSLPVSSFKLALGSNSLELSHIASPAALRSLVIVLFLLALVPGTAFVWGLVRLRRLLDEAASETVFTRQSVADLVVIGNLFLAGAVGSPAFTWLVGMAALAADPSLNVQFPLTPDFSLLLCGFLVRALAVVFARGVKLEDETELMV